MADPPSLPTEGRTFSTSRIVRLGDVTPKSRVRLDAVARYLQDIATDDSLDGKYSEPHSWVVRRTCLWVDSFPRYLDQLHLTTWCGGLGSHWAEGGLKIRSSAGVVIEASALWVMVNFKDMKPVRLSQDMIEILYPASGGRKVGARLDIGRNLPDHDPTNSVTTPWTIRFTDLDAVGHMNNAAYWEVIEQYLSEHVEIRAPFVVTVEHHGSIDRHDSVNVVTQELSGRVVLRHVLADGSVAAVTELVPTNKFSR